MKVVSRANLLNMKNLKISKIFKNVKLHLSRPAGAMTIHRFSKKVEFSERGRKSEIFGAKILRRKKKTRMKMMTWGTYFAKVSHHYWCTSSCKFMLLTSHAAASQSGNHTSEPSHIKQLEIQFFPILYILNPFCKLWKIFGKN